MAQQNESKMKRAFITGFVFLSIMAALVLFLLGTDCFSNSKHLRAMESALRSLPIPEGATIKAVKSRFGLLAGNGNHCDYFTGAIFRTTTISTDTIKAHYAGRRFYNPVTQSQEDFEVTILSSTDSFDSMWLPDSLSTASSWGLTSDDFKEGTTFLVSIFRSYEANNDCRCH